MARAGSPLDMANMFKTIRETSGGAYQSGSAITNPGRIALITKDAATLRVET